MVKVQCGGDLINKEDMWNTKDFKLKTRLCWDIVLLSHLYGIVISYIVGRSFAFLREFFGYTISLFWNTALLFGKYHRIIFPLAVYDIILLFISLTFVFISQENGKIAVFICWENRHDQVLIRN